MRCARVAWVGMLKPTTARTAIVAAKPTAMFPRKSKITPSMAIARIMEFSRVAAKLRRYPEVSMHQQNDGLPHVFKAVADTAKSFEVAGMMRVLLDFFAQPPYVHVD